MDRVKKRYTPVSVRIMPNQDSKIRNAATKNRSVAIFILPSEVTEGGSKSDNNKDSKVEITGVLLLTQKQLLKLKSSPKGGDDWIKILLSSVQLSKNREYGDGNYVSSLL